MGTAPITKNGVHIKAKSNTKGATPIEKNVIVVDEAGNEYEATYPKRAKGLVKNGRARFVAENKICLACPPNENLEDQKMTDNKTENAVLTEKEIFDQIVLLQKQLTENSSTSLYRLGEALYDARGEGEEAGLTDDQVSEICKVFAQREETLYRMLEFYRKMYDDCRNEKERKVDMIKSSFDTILTYLSCVEDSEDKASIVHDVAEKVSDMVSKVISE